MPAAQLTELVDKVDVFEIVRDEIAAILLVETANQVALAVAASRDPLPWQARIYTERTNPWGDFLDVREEQELPLPIVNVSYNGSTYDRSRSNTVERQGADSTYFVDCYAYGASEDVAGGGHRPGDEVAARSAQRVVRNMRNILMSAQYAYLGLRGTVGGRWVNSIDMMEPQVESRAVQRLGAVRLTLQVNHNEFAPQVKGAPFELLSVNVRRAPDGEFLYFTASFSPDQQQGQP